MIKASFTMDFEDQDSVTKFEIWLQKSFTNPVHVSILPDNTDLYENDEVFKKLVKYEKTAKKAKQDYIIKKKNRDYINNLKQ